MTLAPSAAMPTADAAGLLRDLEEHAAATLTSTFVTLWSSLFRLQRSTTFLRILSALLHRGERAVPPATIVARTVDDIALVQAPLAVSVGKVNAVYRLSRHGVARLRGEPYRTVLAKGREIFHLLVSESDMSGQRAQLIFIGTDGIHACLLAAPSKKPPSLVSWLRDHAKRAVALREHLLIELAGFAPKGMAAAIEAQIGAPLERQRVSSGPSGLAAEITCALSTAAGTLVSGWYRDPLNLVAGIAAVGRDGTVHDMTSSLRRYPVAVGVEGGAGQVGATGFAALAPSVGGAAPVLQPRFRLLLNSGAYHMLVPAPQPLDPAGARAAALRAVPPQHVDEKLLDEVLKPVIVNLHERVQSPASRPEIRQIGSPPARPRVSVVIPLYKALDFLRFQIAAFAIDPWFRRNAELIYVLDSPEQAVEVEHLLRGLHLVHELPMSLLIMDRNAGYARACNVGASFARAEVLALVNSDIIPLSQNWLPALVSRLDARKRVGAVGPKLLFEDGSLQHAGMYFEQDHRGRWLNHHYFKGLPRNYPPALVERIVPAVTGACLVTPRALFEKVGGFSEDYVIGDYEDSDLCLKITSEERRILYAPEVELYHLERKSMSLNMDYMKGVAWQYNCALHASRWGETITQIMNTQVRIAKRSKAA
ncbi:glycosyltransferase [Microvirga rosea]|uniref:glycosyltransferase n=1 Tax=Microvirga rosea TaxID=2715425 RepID=UPI001D0AD2F4|nr:glycosyltransferase [Microvirga rosea]MCB8821416.1 glycosyltransferase [Microvirga rosea]